MQLSEKGKVKRTALQFCAWGLCPCHALGCAVSVPCEMESLKFL
jgi:hypothetical protein